jgi:hypothetical protein
VRGYACLSRKVEEHVTDGIADFQENKQTEVLEEIDNCAIVVEHHDGFYHGFWDLRMLFERDFPSIQRRSALITLFAFFEHELDKLCDLLQKVEGYPTSFRDVRAKGIERSSQYLKKTAQLSLPLGTPLWAEIKSIQKIRNAAVHANGRIDTESATSIYVKASRHLSMNGSEIIFGNGYLAHVLDVFEKHLRDLDILLGARYS